MFEARWNLRHVPNSRNTKMVGVPFFLAPTATSKVGRGETKHEKLQETVADNTLTTESTTQPWRVNGLHPKHTKR